MFLSEGDFDAEKDLKEIERLLEECEYEELTRHFEEQTRRVVDINTACQVEKNRYDGLNEYNTECSVNIHDVCSVQKTQLELKSFTKHLEYDFMEEDDQKLMIIASELTPSEKEDLIKVLKKRKNDIAWKITDIKGISPSY